MARDILIEDSANEIEYSQLSFILNAADVSAWMHDLVTSEITLLGSLPYILDHGDNFVFNDKILLGKLLPKDGLNSYRKSEAELSNADIEESSIICKLKINTKNEELAHIKTTVFAKNSNGFPIKLLSIIKFETRPQTTEEKILASEKSYSELSYYIEHEEKLRHHHAELDRKYRLRTEELEEKNIELNKAKRIAEIAQNTAEDFAREQITALKLSETLREEANIARKEALAMAEKAKAADRAKSEFLANISHEIRTPMNAVMGMAAMLAKSELNELQKKQVTTISTSARALLTILNDILDLSQIGAGKLRINNEPFTVQTLCRDIIEMMMTIAMEKNLALNLDYRVKHGAKRLGDTVRIRQALINLINNSIKFTESGHVTLVAKDVIINNTPCIEFRVEDTGIGMTEEECKTVFNKFTQAAQHMTRQHGGVGLGLSICRELIHLMEGEIKVKSQPGVGTTFSFYLPLQILDDDFTTSRFEEMPLDQIIANVLLVEDNLVNQEVSLMLLEDIGCHVDIACNGEDAIKIASLKHFDAILMDLQMPIMDGHKATEILRKSKGINCNTPIAALTGHATDAAKRKCYELGMNGYLTKPLEPMELRSCLIKILANNSVIAAPKNPSDLNTPDNEDEENYLRGKTVLIAEDDETVLRMLEAAFKAKDMHTICCTNGQDALDKFSRLHSHIDLVTTDMRMPEIGGGELCEKIYEIVPTQNIIVISGYYDDARVNELFTSGKAFFLKKPFTLAVFSKVLKDVFST